ncbi:MAG TPA: OsmC family protein, partial [Thermoplasmata archaeon]|nr:OsmC family protein [Thermoplasmata archaeon]
MDFVSTVSYGDAYPARMECQNGMSLDYSPPVEFGGVKGPMTPEDAFVGSANMCFQIVFRSVAQGLGMSLLDYRCKAVADLQTVDGFRKFVRINLYPEMRLSEGARTENLQKAIDATKK